MNRGEKNEFSASKENIAENMEQFSLKSPRKVLSENISNVQSKYKEISNSNKSENSLEVELEPLLIENPLRFVLFPIEYPDIWDMYKKHEALFWTADEIDLSKDVVNWKKLESKEQYFIEHTLACFVTTDCILNLVKELCQEVQAAEARCFYGFQIAMENEHVEIYVLLMETFVEDYTNRNRLCDAIENMPSIKKRADWILKWNSNNSKTFGERILAMAVAKGIFFSGSFASIASLKQRNLMPGLILSNELISRDEKLYCDFASLMFKYLVKKPSKERIIEIVSEAVTIEKEFLTNDLPVDLIGMDCVLMSRYIEFVADCLLRELGVEKIYDTQNPFSFMDQLISNNSENISSSKYLKRDAGAKCVDNVFTLDANF